MEGGRTAALVALGAVYGAIAGVLLYRRWLELAGRVARLEDRVFRLEFPPVKVADAGEAKEPAARRPRVAAPSSAAPAEV